MYFLSLFYWWCCCCYGHLTVLSCVSIAAIMTPIFLFGDQSSIYWLYWRLMGWSSLWPQLQGGRMTAEQLGYDSKAVQGRTRRARRPSVKCAEPPAGCDVCVAVCVCVFVRKLDPRGRTKMNLVSRNALLYREALRNQASSLEELIQGWRPLESTRCLTLSSNTSDYKVIYI